MRLHVSEGLAIFRAVIASPFCSDTPTLQFNKQVNFPSGLKTRIKINLVHKRLAQQPSLHPPPRPGAFPHRAQSLPRCVGGTRFSGDAPRVRTFPPEGPLQHRGVALATGASCRGSRGGSFRSAGLPDPGKTPTRRSSASGAQRPLGLAYSSPRLSDDGAATESGGALAWRGLQSRGVRLPEPPSCEGGVVAEGLRSGPLHTCRF